MCYVQVTRFRGEGTKMLKANNVKYKVFGRQERIGWGRSADIRKDSL